ncbi:MAG: DNA repair protein RecO [Maricaulaceae bacterium]
MDWASEGYIISVRRHGESSAIVEVLTPDMGRHAGLVRGATSRRMRPLLEIGNKVHVSWRSRLSEHLGYYAIEPIEMRAATLMMERVSLMGLNVTCAVAKTVLPERQSFPHVYAAFDVLMQNFEDPEIWPALYVRWEMGVLSALGYGLDLSCCASTGVVDNLTHVSPRSGRAVSAEAATPYLDKLYPLPSFMIGGRDVSGEDIENGLRLTAYFLETRVQWGVNQTLPDNRRMMIERLQSLGAL